MDREEKRVVATFTVILNGKRFNSITSSYPSIENAKNDADDLRNWLSTELRYCSKVRVIAEYVKYHAKTDEFPF